MCAVAFEQRGALPCVVEVVAFGVFMHLHVVLERLGRIIHGVCSQSSAPGGAQNKAPEHNPRLSHAVLENRKVPMNPRSDYSIARMLSPGNNSSRIFKSFLVQLIAVG
jgi:hypothetical protein